MNKTSSLYLKSLHLETYLCLHLQTSYFLYFMVFLNGCFEVGAFTSRSFDNGWIDPRFYILAVGLRISDAKFCFLNMLSDEPNMWIN